MKKFPISIMIAVLLLTACGSGKPHTPTPANTDTPNPPTATPITQIPDGTYITSITKAELVNAGLDESLACENAGTLAMTAAGDKWSIIQTGVAGCTVHNPNFGGTWKFSGNQVTFHENEPFGCKGDYTYQWKLTGTSLSFTSVDDADCVQRVYYLSKHPWQRQK